MLGEWTGAPVDPGDRKPSPDEWTPVEIPGRPASLAGEAAVAYRTTFEDPRSGEDDRAVLELRGLYAHARVWLNDEPIGRHDAYFAPFRHSFEPAGRNELVVACRAPADRFGGIHDTAAVPEADRVPGIWWGARVLTHPLPYLFDLVARPRLDADDTIIDVRAVVESGGPLSDRLTLSLRPEGGARSRGMMDRVPVEADSAGRTTVEHAVPVHDPKLWWPRGLGSQHRYAVRAKLGEDSRTVTTGLGEIDRNEDGLFVNGRRFAARGFNLLSATPGDIERAAAANANLVRMQAHVPPPAVYEACDEAGLLVWQDLPLTGPGAFDVERGRELAGALGDAYGRFPSLAAVTVHDDPVDPYPDVLGSGLLDRLRLRWRAWRAEYDRADAEAVAGALPSGPLVLPVAGPPGTAPDAAHLYPGWDYGAPGDVDWLLDRYPSLGRTVGEFGAGGPEGSQAHQARVLKRVAEALRRRGADLLAAYALRDADGASMGVLERDGTEKAGCGAIADSFEPVLATLHDPSPGASAVSVVNDLPEPVSGRLEWEAGDEAGRTDVEAEPGARIEAASITIPPGAGEATLVLALAERRVENTYRL